jgi:cytidine deaminase
LTVSIGDADLDRLFAAAETARARAYAPYSGFTVGAAVLSPSGDVHSGCNVENAAYPLGQCAESAAISAMIGQGDSIIRAICVVGGPAGAAPVFVTPCGGCRQRIREFGGPTTAILARGDHGEPRRFTLGELLPHAFGPQTLAFGPQTPGPQTLGPQTLGQPAREDPAS